MGYCVTMPPPNEGGPKMFGIETRRESVIVSRHYEKWPPETPAEMFGMETPGVSGLYSVEMSKDYLSELLAFFDNPNNRVLCGLNVPPPFPDGI